VIAPVPSRGGQARAVLGLSGLCLALLWGCAVDRSTRLAVEDFQAVAAEMGQSLMASEALRSRGPQSPLWVVSMDKPVNLSSDVIPADEQWAMVSMIRGRLPLAQLDQGYNVRFVLPPERTTQIRTDPDLPEVGPGFGGERQPTHSLVGTIRSATRTTADRRTELYVLEFEIVDLATGTPVWADRFEFKRQAKGAIRD